MRFSTFAALEADKHTKVNGVYKYNFAGARQDNALNPIYVFVDNDGNASNPGSQVYKWVGTWNDTNGNVSYSIAYKDLAGNDGSAVTSGSGSVTFDKTPPTLSNVSIASNNSNTTLAKVGNEIILTFTASETIQTPTVTFQSGGQSINDTITYTNTSGNTWTAKYIAHTNDTNGNVTYSIAYLSLIHI